MKRVSNNELDREEKEDILKAMVSYVTEHPFQPHRDEDISKEYREVILGKVPIGDRKDYPPTVQGTLAYDRVRTEESIFLSVFTKHHRNLYARLRKLGKQYDFVSCVYGGEDSAIGRRYEGWFYPAFDVAGTPTEQGVRQAEKLRVMNAGAVESQDALLDFAERIAKKQKRA